MIWKGVMPAITTCFDEALQIDHGFRGRTLPVAAGQRMQRRRGAGFFGRRRDPLIRGKSRNRADGG